MVTTVDELTGALGAMEHAGAASMVQVQKAHSVEQALNAKMLTVVVSHFF